MKFLSLFCAAQVACAFSLSRPIGSSIRLQSSISPIVAEESLLTSSPVSSALSISSGGSALKKKIDIPLALYFLGWYVGNYYYVSLLHQIILAQPPPY